MLKKTCLYLTLAFFPYMLFSQTGKNIIDPREHYDVTFEEDIQNNLVTIYERSNPIGTFNNILRNKGSINSELIRLTGGDIALRIESEGSRYKYDIFAPISIINHHLYIECILKKVYDSIEERIYTGSVCGHTDLAKFDIDSSITEDGLYLYEDINPNLKYKKINECTRPSGFDFGNNFVINCPTKNKKSIDNVTYIANKKGEIIFSITGYEFFANQDGNTFFIKKDLYDQSIYLKSSLSCLERDSISMNNHNLSHAMIGKYRIIYNLSRNDNCYNGSYEYANKSVPIDLDGLSSTDILYLLERNNNRQVTGIFILKKFDSFMNGLWISVPESKIYSVTP